MKRKSNCLATILFLIYLALLVWIILFKLQFSISDLDKVRRVSHPDIRVFVGIQIF